MPQASQLGQWPCQIKLVPINAPYFADAHLLVAADCTLMLMPTFIAIYAQQDHDHRLPNLMIVIMGEATAILKSHDLKSLTVLRMEVPCCGGIVNGVKQALMASGKMIPWHVVTVSTDGNIVED